MSATPSALSKTTLTSIRDIPRNAAIASHDDSFGITPFEQGLTKFIEGTDTPITIALQGEWGSGKTSLMYSLQESLVNKADSKYQGIWLNTWEYAMMNAPSDTLIEILGALIKQILEKDDEGSTKTKVMLEKLWNIGKKAAVIAAKTAANTSGLNGDEIMKAFSSDGNNSSIGEIRDGLQEAINKFIKKNQKRGFIFFIDDLDRIDPPVAVQLLELLKNIFTLDHCVFILAIDYDVVVKGLEPKFGKLTDKNEREFRSFFDKIIQVPFSMPVSGYRTDEFIKKSLTDIGYLKDNMPNDDALIETLAEIATLSVGTNPRSLKRLLNSLSLINCINSIQQDQNSEDNREHTPVELMVNFALVSIQIAYPPIYRLLLAHPDFIHWNNQVALELNLEELDGKIQEKLKEIEEFDEEWEKILYRLCETDHYLKKNALNISRLLNKLKTKIELEEGEITVEEMIKSIISLSSVTSLDATQSPILQYDQDVFLKKLGKNFIEQVKKSSNLKLVKIFKPRTKGAVYITFVGEDWKDWIRLDSAANKDGIAVSATGLFKILDSKKEINDYLENPACKAELDRINTDWKNQFQDSIIAFDLIPNIQKRTKEYVMVFRVSYTLKTLADFEDTSNLITLAEAAIGLRVFMNTVSKEVKALFAK